MDANGEGQAADSGTVEQGEPDESWVNESIMIDPESLGPDVPGLDRASGSSNDEAVNLFVKLVIVFDFAILALTVGPMMVVFQGKLGPGLQIFGVGALAFAYGAYRYYQFRASTDDDHGERPEQNG